MELRDCQFPLRHRDYPSIVLPTKDPSKLDMSKVRLMEKERMLREGTLVGHLVQSDFDIIFEWLRDSEIYSNKEKKKYGWIKG